MTSEHRIDASVIIRATRATVFRFFTDSTLFADWWGAGSRIDPRPGGEVHICYPGGTIAGGRIESLEPDRRIVFSYGYQDPARLIPAEGSRVTIALADVPGGTRVDLVHELADAAARDAHVQGWRFQLSLYANAAAAVQHADLAVTVDRWFALWSQADDGARAAELAAIAAPAVSFHDRFSAISGAAALSAHIAAARRHMPGAVIARDGAPRHCQGTAVVDWVMRGPDGADRARGCNVFELAGDGAITRVVGLWA